MAMDIREVRSFLALAGQSHFGRTAGLLNLSQPALTKQIRRLEEDLGGPLLVRGGHGAQLTSLGRLFQAKALCSKYGFRPRILQEVPGVTTVLALVKAGLGVSVIPESLGINCFVLYLQSFLAAHTAGDDHNSLLAAEQGGDACSEVARCVATLR